MFGYGIDKKTLYIVGKVTTLLSLNNTQEPRNVEFTAFLGSFFVAFIKLWHIKSSFP